MAEKKNVNVQKGKFTLRKGGAKTTNALIEELKAKKAAQAGGGASGEGDSEKSPAAAAPEVRRIPIEEEILKLFEGIPPRSIPELTRFWSELAPKLSLPALSQSVLEAFSNIDVTAERVGQILARNGYYADQFQKIVDSMGKREETPSLESAVVLLGMTNSRNLILALQMQRSLTGKHPEWKVVPPKKEPALQIKPSEWLKYAIRTEEPLMAAKSPYADTAFAAGLIFDWFAAYAKQENRTDLTPYIEIVYTHSLKTAKIASHLALGIPELADSKWVFSAALLHDIGKLVMAVYFPNYSRFMELCGKRALPREVRHYAERERYKVDHATLGGAVCSLVPVFQTVAPVVRQSHHPFLLKKQPGGLYSLAQLIAFASSIATQSKKPEKDSDPIIETWRGKEVLDLQFPLLKLQEAVALS